MTLTAMRPDSGRSNGREMSLWSNAHASARVARSAAAAPNADLHMADGRLWSGNHAPSGCEVPQSLATERPDARPGRDRGYASPLHRSRAKDPKRANSITPKRRASVALCRRSRRSTSFRVMASSNESKPAVGRVGSPSVGIIPDARDSAVKRPRGPSTPARGSRRSSPDRWAERAPRAGRTTPKTTGSSTNRERDRSAPVRFLHDSASARPLSALPASPRIAVHSCDAGWARSVPGPAPTAMRLEAR